jgi:hypothetical protein
MDTLVSDTDAESVWIRFRYGEFPHTTAAAAATATVSVDPFIGDRKGTSATDLSWLPVDGDIGGYFEFNEWVKVAKIDSSVERHQAAQLHGGE